MSVSGSRGSRVCRRLWTDRHCASEVAAADAWLAGDVSLDAEVPLADGTPSERIDGRTGQ